MSDGWDDSLVGVRADTRGFARDVAEMRGTLEGSLATGADRAGRGIEGSLLRAARTGKLGFEDLKRTALGVMDDIARAALRGGVGAALGRGGGGLLGGVLGAALGLPGRATGGPVSPARPYLVGERGPELFVPTASGSIEPTGGGGARQVNVAIRVSAEAGAAPAALARSSRQVARAVRAALEAGD